MERVLYAGFPRVRTTLNLSLDCRLKLALLAKIAKMSMNQVVELLISQVELEGSEDRNLAIGQQLEAGKTPSEIIKDYSHQLSMEL